MPRAPAVTLLAALSCGCADSVLDQADPASFEAEPTWSEDIAPLLERSCVSCHDGRGAFEGGVELATYAAARSTRVPATCTAISQDVADHFADVLVLPTDSGGDASCSGWEPLSMPPGTATRLSPTEQVLLARWVELGAPE